MYKLLIVDDEYEIRNGLCNYFPWNDIGFEVAGQAENGKQALEYLQKHYVDVVFSDIKMPVMSGIDLARELKHRNEKIKMVFLSGYKDFEYVRSALDYGVRNYIVKPTKFSELVDVFSRIKKELDQEVCYRDASNQAHRQDISVKEYSYNEKIIAAIKEYVTLNYVNANLRRAAELVHMNPYYLSKFFKEKTGQNFSDFLIEKRMEKAAQLLKDIEYKTYEIGTMVGYSNAKNFARTFRRYFGKSPKEFRKGNM